MATESNAINPGELAPEISNIPTGWFIFLGILMVLIGTGAIIMPVLATFAVDILLGWLLISAGIVEAIRAFQAKGTKSVIWAILVALLCIGAGIFILANPLKAIMTLTLILAAFFLAEGIIKIIMSFQLKPTPGWGWTLFSGFVGIILAGLIWSEWPGSAAWVLGLLLGIDLIFGGWSMIMIALAARGAPARMATA